MDAARLLAVIPKNAYFADLPAADIAATVDPADAEASPDPAALPALLSSPVGHGGTVVVLVAGKLYGASTTVPGRLRDALGARKRRFPRGGDGTAALVALMRSLAGSGNLRMPPARATRAGRSVGAADRHGGPCWSSARLALWWWLRRPPSRRRRRRRPARPLAIWWRSTTGPGHRQATRPRATGGS